MDFWKAALWGLAGGVCMEALDLYRQIRDTPGWNWRKPIPQGLPAYVISILIRVAIGGILAAAGSGQLTGPLAALGLGVSAPAVLEKLARNVPLKDSSHPSSDIEVGSSSRE
ncbi:hypothetical protein [Actinomadura sp. DC4]|uniref:hypothetical protein n=1 Tax=Actinomadura sp. DC4 TaxID=3055069 RepID=UPI0025B0E8C2|nr:hypothetical protein [Actinomadura sp. DC4]MDN3353625.1 hypothetical protein [Actinomadura sp. DC4]